MIVLDEETLVEGYYKSLLPDEMKQVVKKVSMEYKAYEKAKEWMFY